jgi:hypothetical protein
MPMPNEKPDAVTERIVQALSNGPALRRAGVDDEWIQRCADLVDEFQRLQHRFQELEAKLSRTGGQSGDDTIVF